jgi:NADPH2:quinone reductase
MTTASALTYRALIVDAPNGDFREASLPMPVAGRGQVLVRVHASGVNMIDTKIRAGAAAHAGQPLPAVLGVDMAGVVAAVGAGVDAFAAGDEVYGLSGGVAGLAGSLAEFQLVDADVLAKKPRNLSMRDAAALPLVLVTAWEGLVDRAHVQAGQKVLVHGGAGGVGHVAVQIAHALGAEVFATARAAQADTVRGFGATPIDYTTTTVADYVAQHTGGAGFDVVYDTVGGETLDASFVAARAYGGHVVSALGWGTHKLAPLSFKAATYSGVFTLRPLLTGEGRANHGHILREAARLIEAGRILPLMDPRRFTLATAQSAYDDVAAGRARGRVVIDVVA